MPASGYNGRPVPTGRRAYASHLGAFLAGAVIATAVGAPALPGPRANADRYAALDTFAQSLSYIANQYVDPVDERLLIYGGVSGMVSRLDEHSAFLPPQLYRRLREDTEGEFGGIGITLEAGPDTSSETNHPVVRTVVAGSPAARAGLAAGDRLLAVDGKPTAGKDVRASARVWEMHLRGRSGTRLELMIRRPSWPQPRRFSLLRERVKVPTVEWLALEPGIGYLALKRFQEATSADVGNALRILLGRGVESLILDLRNNPGGLLDQAVRVADLFLDKGVIVTIRSRTDDDEQAVAHAPGTFSDLRLLVLVDEGTASAAEILAGALQDHGRAIIMGQPSYGKGSVQTFMNLRDGSGLKLTTARYYTPRGKSLEGTGITPDVMVEAFAGDVIVAGTADADTAGEDEVDTTRGLEERLRGDLQFETAHQTVMKWSGSKPASVR